MLAKRPSNKHQGGLWEFPGGKCERGELPIEALAREIERRDWHNNLIVRNFFESLEHD